MQPPSVYMLSCLLFFISPLPLPCSYVFDALGCLDTDDSITRQHMHSVLGTVKEKMSEFLSRNPKHPSKSTVLRIERSIKQLTSTRWQ